METGALAGIQQTAIEAAKANRLDTHVPAVILRDANGQQRVESIEHLQAHRSRSRGTFSTASLNDFAQYVIRRPGGQGFIQPDQLSANVIFNLDVDGNGVPVDVPADAVDHTVAIPCAGHGDYRAVLALKATPAYAALQTAAKTQYAQKAIIEWAEDWWDCLAADYSIAPDNASDPTGMRRALNALRKVKVKATAEAVHTNKDFGASRSALEDVEASSDEGLPLGFRFICQPSDDLDSRIFYLRLGVLTGGEKPVFVLRWSKRESDIEAIGQNFKAKLLDAVAGKATMLLGTFDPGK